MSSGVRESVVNTKNRSFAVTAEVEIPAAGAEGVITRPRWPLRRLGCLCHGREGKVVRLQRSGTLGRRHTVRHGRVPVEARSEAERLDTEVRQNIQQPSNYVLTVVLYAVGLSSFAGMSSRLQDRCLMILAGCAVLGALAWIATSPVSLAA